MQTIFVDNVSKLFSHHKPVLDAISTRFVQGEQYAITGKSGSGKSTLLHIVGLLDTPTYGTVWYNEHNTATIDSNKRRDFFLHSIGFLLQYSHFIEELSVLANVELAGLIENLPYKEQHARALSLLQQVEMDQYIDCMPYTLSGGQRQRVGLARALMRKPAFLLADEPTGNLDPHTAEIIHQLILTCQQEWNMGLIISTHDPLLVKKLAHTMVIEHGTLRQER